MLLGPNGNHEIIPLPNDTGIVQFAVWASEGTVDDPEDNDVMIDNFAVNPIPTCNHTLNMIDTYGDGWNGNAVDITVNGVTVVSGATIPSGSHWSCYFLSFYWKYSCFS